MLFLQMMSLVLLSSAILVNAETSTETLNLTTTPKPIPVSLGKVTKIETSMGSKDPFTYVTIYGETGSSYCEETYENSKRVTIFFEIAKMSFTYGLPVQSTGKCNLSIIKFTN